MIPVVTCRWPAPPGASTRLTNRYNPENHRGIRNVPPPNRDYTQKMGSVGWKRGDAVSIAICCATLPRLECLSLIHHDRVSDLLFIGIFVLDSSRDISVQTYKAHCCGIAQSFESLWLFIFHIDKNCNLFAYPQQSKSKTTGMAVQ